MQPSPTKQFICTAPVEGIEPVDGWALYSTYEWDSDGFRRLIYAARRDDCERMLHVSRFFWDATQENFEFLVRNQFPSASGTGPWTNGEIAERRAEGAGA